MARKAKAQKRSGRKPAGQHGAVQPGFFMELMQLLMQLFGTIPAAREQPHLMRKMSDLHAKVAYPGHPEAGQAPPSDMTDDQRRHQQAIENARSGWSADRTRTFAQAELQEQTQLDRAKAAPSTTTDQGATGPVAQSKGRTGRAQRTASDPVQRTASDPVQNNQADFPTGGKGRMSKRPRRSK